MCNCNHKSRQDERKCCCNCHGKSNMGKSCNNKDVSSILNEQKEENKSYEKPYEKR